jgi:acetoin utilization deacetylase AcuC-like enzyme
MPDKTDDQLYLQTLRNTLPKLINQVRPDFIFYLSGVDVLESDKLGRLSLSRKGCKERDRLVIQTCKDYKIPVAVSMGGGYSPLMTDIIDAHANTFRVAQDIYF